MLRRAGLWFLVAVSIAATVPGSVAAAAGYEGRPLAEVLQSLQRQGVAIVFTSQLVRPEMKVVREPAAREPRQLLEEILAPYGLRVQEGPEGVLVVVAKGAGGGGKTAVEAGVPAPESPPPPIFHDEIVVQPSRLSLLHEPADPSWSLGREEIESLPHLDDVEPRSRPRCGRRPATARACRRAQIPQAADLNRPRVTELLAANRAAPEALILKDRYSLAQGTKP